MRINNAYQATMKLSRHVLQISFSKTCCICLFLFATSMSRTHAFTPSSIRPTTHRAPLTRQHAVAAASLLAGSLAGAIGVGVAHPLDTLNIKCQVLQAATSLAKLNAKRKQPTIQVVEDDDMQNSDSYLYYSPLDGMSTTMNSSMAIDPVGRSFSTRLQATASLTPPRRQTNNNYSRNHHRISPFAPSDRILNTVHDDGDGSPDRGIEGRARVDTWQVMRHVYETEGIDGFLGGIRIMMMGQGLVKATSFTVNTVVLNWEVAHAASQTDSPTTAMFILAAASAGLVSSFIVNPVERVKILLQAASSSDRASESEWECIQRVVKSEGLGGFLGRGLGTTMLREIPSDAVYFSVYGLLMQAMAGSGAVMAPWLASLLFGATSGVASWIPVYPVDYVKTLVQDTNGSSDEGAKARDTWQVVQDLYASGGVGAFYDGITPKLLRAGVFHAVTFWVYDTILPSIESTLSLIHLSSS